MSVCVCVRVRARVLRGQLSSLSRLYQYHHPLSSPSPPSPPPPLFFPLVMWQLPTQPFLANQRHHWDETGAV